jgi:uncharacterized protein (DUF983 family)
MASRVPRILRTLRNGFCGRCPACGRGKLFESWNQLRDECVICKFPLVNLQENTWAFMYLSTAGLTGSLVVAMFLLTPSDVKVGRFVVFLVAILGIAGTLPYRKGIAIAIEYLVELRWGGGEHGGGEGDEPKSRGSRR